MRGFTSMNLKIKSIYESRKLYSRRYSRSLRTKLFTSILSQPVIGETMAKLFMIDTASMGIRKVFNLLRKKYFPMPDYDISAQQVSVTVYGKILDLNYTRLLFDNPDFDLNTVFLWIRSKKEE